jgi:hypothetical protein
MSNKLPAAAAPALAADAEADDIVLAAARASEKAAVVHEGADAGCGGRCAARWLEASVERDADVSDSLVWFLWVRERKNPRDRNRKGGGRACASRSLGCIVVLAIGRYSLTAESARVPGSEDTTR